MITLYELCPDCGGVWQGWRQGFLPGTIQLVGCKRCKGAGYVEHVCSLDDNCPCFAGGRQQGVQAPRTPLGV